MGKGARGNGPRQAGAAHLTILPLVDAVLSTNGPAAMERTGRSTAPAPKSAFGPGSMTPRAPPPAQPRSARAPPAAPAAAARREFPPDIADASGRRILHSPSKHGLSHVRVLGTNCDQLRRRIAAWDAKGPDAPRGPPMHALANADGVTPLHLACRGGFVDCVALLLATGASANARDAFGWAPAHDCAAHGNESILRMLAEHGAQLHLATKDGWTPLHFAAFNGSTRAVLLLLRHGANPDRPAGLGGLSAREIATKFKQSTIASLFDAVEKAGSVDKFLSQLQ